MSENKKEEKPLRNIPIEVLRPIRLFGEKAVINPSTNPQKKMIIKVSEEEAKEFCDKSFEGFSGESGERGVPFPTTRIFRAKRVSK